MGEPRDRAGLRLAQTKPLPEELPIDEVSKSGVSERFVVGIARQLAALTERKLEGLKLIQL
jgi:hypothetical protein